MAIGNTISYLYKVTEFYLLFPTEEIELLPESLTHLAIFNDYEQNVLPITQINATMSREAYFKLIAQKDKVKIRLRIQKYYTRDVDGKESLKSDYINDTFSIIWFIKYFELAIPPVIKIASTFPFTTDDIAAISLAVW